jgi:1-acyl-sn-glycerol-3-phosphate acyltransferase
LLFDRLSLRDPAAFAGLQQSYLFGAFMAYRFARFLVRLILKLVAHLDLLGHENIAGFNESALVVSNHLGRLDVALVYHYLDRQDILVLVAEKYQKVAWIRWFVKALGAVFVDRFNADLNTMRIALNHLKQGKVLVLAPEGTRSPTGALIEARTGASYLAARSGVWVVPIAIYGSEDKAVVEALRHFRRVHITASVGKPFKFPPLQAGNREEMLQVYTDEMMCRIAVMLPEKYRGFYASHPRLQELLAETAKSSEVVS